MPVACLWLLTQVAFLKSLRSGWWIIPFGIVFGLAAGTKFTGWFAIVPPLAWAFLYEWVPRARRLLARLTGSERSMVSIARPAVPWKATRIVLLGVVIGALTLYAVQPPWWSDPLRGVERVLASNLSRDKSIPVTSFYLGNAYLFSLPWHNTLVLTVATTPALVLGLGILGIVWSANRCRCEPDDMLWVLSWGVLMVGTRSAQCPGS